MKKYGSLRSSSTVSASAIVSTSVHVAILDDPTREFFRRFLESRFYNSEDEYLVVNEVQAYLLQQQLESVSDYFLEWAVPKFKADMPEYAEQVDRFVRRDPAVFYRMASALVDSRWNSMRVRPGALLCLTEAEGR